GGKAEILSTRPHCAPGSTDVATFVRVCTASHCHKPHHQQHRHCKFSHWKHPSYFGLEVGTREMRRDGWGDARIPARDGQIAVLPSRMPIESTDTNLAPSLA